MSRRTRPSSSTTFIGAVAASALLALAVAPAASAAKIYTCVSKGGAMKLVSAKTKCKHGERKVSWNASGPAGAPGAVGSPGAEGSPGAPGTNGVGADFASYSFGPTELAGGENGDVVVSKTIPAGTYFVNANTVIGAAGATTAVFAAVVCELVDSSGTVSIVEFPKALDIGEWLQQLSKSESAGSEYEGATTIAMQTQLTTTEPTTLAMICGVIEGSKEAKFLAAASQLSALQTTANK